MCRIVSGLSWIKGPKMGCCCYYYIPDKFVYEVGPTAINKVFNSK